MKIKVYNMSSPRTGNPVADQFEIHTDEGAYFQSYRRILAFIPHSREKKTQLDEIYWNYSRTTSKYLRQFLNQYTSTKSSQEIKAKIASGDFELVNLN